MNKLSTIIAIIITGMLFMGCELDNGSSDDVNTLKRTGIIEFINNNRSEVITEDGWLVNLYGAFILKQRSSCSGFEVDSSSSLNTGDTIEYKYINDKDNTVIYSTREVTPFEITVYRPECLSSGNSIQYVLDSDFDGIGDITDNCDFTPNTNQKDTDLDGVGDACDSAPNDPNVQ